MDGTQPVINAIYTVELYVGRSIPLINGREEFTGQWMPTTTYTRYIDAIFHIVRRRRQYKYKFSHYRIESIICDDTGIHVYHDEYP